MRTGVGVGSLHAQARWIVVSAAASSKPCDRAALTVLAPEADSTVAVFSAGVVGSPVPDRRSR
jgi:hypothetical protein